jgi:hypothetical protein
MGISPTLWEHLEKLLKWWMEKYSRYHIGGLYEMHDILWIFGMGQN